MTRPSSSRASRLMKQGVATFLEGVAELAGGRRAGLRTGKIPVRVAKAWRDELLAGYREDPGSILTPLSTRSAGGLVATRDIEFSSVCMHHLLPFQGRVHVAYAPDGRITGLSRLTKLVDCLSRRLQLQEGLTRQIVDEIQRQIGPAGAACVVDASHTCMTMRGARKAQTRVVTMAFSGVFRKSPARRREALAALGVKAR